MQMEMVLIIDMSCIIQRRPGLMKAQSNVFAIQTCFPIFPIL